MEIFTDKVASNVCIKNKRPDLLNIDSKNLLIYDPIERNFQIDEKYFEYALSKLEKDGNVFKWKNVNDMNIEYSNKTSDSYFDVPYYKRNKVRNKI